MKIYPEAPEKNSCTLANKVLTYRTIHKIYTYADAAKQAAVDTAQASAKELVLKDSQDYSKSYTLSEIGKLEASGGNLVKGYRFSDDNIKAYWNTAGTIKSGQNDPDGGKNAVAISQKQKSSSKKERKYEGINEFYSIKHRRR